MNLTWDISQQQLYPYVYKQPDASMTIFSLTSAIYDNSDFAIIGFLDLYNEAFSSINSSVASVNFAMRINSQTGFVKWTNSFYVK